MTTPAFTRAVTIFAAGFLLLNAVLLGMINRLVWAAVFFVAAVLVVVGWFCIYQRFERDLAEDLKDMKREIESLRQLLHTHRRK